MTFRFRLETVLKLRRAERDQRRAEVAEALEAENVLREQDGQLAAELEEIRVQSRRGAEPGEVQVDQLLQTHRWELLTAVRRQQLQQQMRQVAAEVERRRAVLVEADREVQVLERLREQKAAQYDDQQRKREIEALDEIAVQRAARRR